MKQTGRGKMLFMVLAVGVFCTAGCGLGAGKPSGGKSQEKIILRYAEVNPSEHIITKTGQYFADQVQRLSEGRIEIQIYDSGQLGDDSQYYQQMQMGALDMYRGNTIALSQLAQAKAGILALPYLFRDREHFWKVCTSSLGKEILADIQASGSRMVGLCYLDEGARNIMMVKHPILHLEDMKDQRIRSMDSALLEDTLSAFGARPIVIGYPDLYNELQSGEIDGAENPVCSYYYNQFYQEAPFYIKTGHTHSPSILLVSEITWKHLTEEDKELIQKAADMAMEYNQSELAQAEEEVYQKLEEQGVMVIEPEDLDTWREQTAGIYAEYDRRYPGVIEEIQEME